MLGATNVLYKQQLVMPYYDRSMFPSDDVTMNRVCSFITLILIFIKVEKSSNELSSKLVIPNGLSHLESQISMMSNDPEAERRLRDRWNAFVAETTKELDFDIKVLEIRSKIQPQKYLFFSLD